MTPSGIETSILVEIIALKITAERSQNAQGHGRGVPCSVHISSEACRWEKLHMPKLFHLFIHTETEKTSVNLKFLLL